MKKIIISAAFAVASLSLNAQIKVTTGDSELDKSLIELNTAAKNSLDAFKKDAVEKFNVATSVVDNLLNIHKMEPSDVIMSLEVAQIAHQPVDQVATLYDKNKSKGWGEIAKEMGIKPGSKEFHQLKDNAKGKSKSMKGKGHDGEKESGKGNGHGKGKGKK
jgi:hypothetical protein